MAHDVWLPKGYMLPGRIKIRSLLYTGDNWQIFATDGLSNILLVRPKLAEKWSTSGLLDAAVFGRVPFGNEIFWSILSDKNIPWDLLEAASPRRTQLMHWLLLWLSMNLESY